MHIEEIHKLRVFLKSGQSFVLKGVRNWEFSTSGYKFTHTNRKYRNIARLPVDSIEAVVIIGRHKEIFWRKS